MPTLSTCLTVPMLARCICQFLSWKDLGRLVLTCKTLRTALLTNTRLLLPNNNIVDLQQEDYARYATHLLSSGLYKVHTAFNGLLSDLDILRSFAPEFPLHSIILTTRDLEYACGIANARVRSKTTHITLARDSHETRWAHIFPTLSPLRDFGSLQELVLRGGMWIVDKRNCHAIQHASTTLKSVGFKDVVFGRATEFACVLDGIESVKIDMPLFPSGPDEQEPTYFDPAKRFFAMKEKRTIRRLSLHLTTDDNAIRTDWWILENSLNLFDDTCLEALETLEVIRNSTSNTNAAQFAQIDTPQFDYGRLQRLCTRLAKVVKDPASFKLRLQNCLPDVVSVDWLQNIEINARRVCVSSLFRIFPTARHITVVTSCCFPTFWDPQSPVSASDRLETFAVHQQGEVPMTVGAILEILGCIPSTVEISLTSETLLWSAFACTRGMLAPILSSVLQQCGPSPASAKTSQHARLAQMLASRPFKRLTLDVTGVDTPELIALYQNTVANLLDTSRVCIRLGDGIVIRSRMY